MSLDAYRGLVMLAMAAEIGRGGFGFTSIVHDHPEVKQQYAGKFLGRFWPQLWDTLAYQFQHVAWTGCAFWDLIQPSFMFMVGVAIPFSDARRRAEGQSWPRRFVHVLWRSAVLILLGVFLVSKSGPQTNFTFVNVLTQIGLGYAFVFLFVNRHWVIQLLAIAALLGGYGWFFYQYQMPASERSDVIHYLQNYNPKDGSPRDPNKPREKDWDQFEGLPSHWNKHTNAAAAADHKFLNAADREINVLGRDIRFLPRPEAPYKDKRFWVNDGGYQTLNFIPSAATMLMGLMAGQFLLGGVASWGKMWRLLLAGLVCLLLAMAADTTIWPEALRKAAGATWTLCPIVKRIWTPTWTVFSGGWTLVLLALFYLVIDVWGWRRLAFPLVVVGMNSIAMYVMAQLIKPWVSKMLEYHSVALGKAINYDLWGRAIGDNFYGKFWESLAVLFVLWLVCAWMYWRKIFLRI